MFILLNIILCLTFSPLTLADCGDGCVAKYNECKDEALKEPDDDPQTGKIAVCLYKQDSCYEECNGLKITETLEQYLCNRGCNKDAFACFDLEVAEKEECFLKRENCGRQCIGKTQVTMKQYKCKDNCMNNYYKCQGDDCINEAEKCSENCLK